MKGINEIRMAVKAYFNEEYAEENRFNHTFSVDLWEKGDKKRAYINRTNGRNNKCVGWVDLNTLELNDFSSWKLEARVKEALA